MQLGDTGEKMTVTAETPLLEQASSSLGQVVDEHRLAQMPMAHGQPYALLTLSPGLSFTLNPQFDRPYEGNHLTGFTMDGVRAGRSEVTLDGSPNTAVMHKFPLKGNMATSPLIRRSHRRADLAATLSPAF